MRGGSWNNNPQNCRSAFRNNNNTRDNNNNNNGFRVVCAVGSALHPKGSSVCWSRFPSR
ncbi:MAG: SUMF1/EgtB/PvdO family nonheme iron enzyme [Rivularia sp. (in: cyanobacteria)]